MDLQSRLGLAGAYWWDVRRLWPSAVEGETRARGAAGATTGGGEGGLNILSSGNAPNISLLFAWFLNKCLPLSSSTPSLTIKVPGAATVPDPSANGGRSAPSEDDLDDGGESRPETSRLAIILAFSSTAELDLEVGSPRAGACPRPRRDPRLAWTESTFRGSDFDGNDFGNVEGGGEGDDSTHSSSNSSVCQPGVAITIIVYADCLLFIYQRLIDSLVQSQSRVNNLLLFYPPPLACTCELIP
jgi:hypothetical protein